MLQWKLIILPDLVPSPLPKALSQVKASDPVATFMSPEGTEATVHTQQNFANTAYFVGEKLELGISDRVCSLLPFSHPLGQSVGIWSSLLHGAFLVIPSNKFDAQLALDAITQEKCTVLVGTPESIHGVLSQPKSRKHDLSTVKQVVFVNMTNHVKPTLDIVQQLKSVKRIFTYNEGIFVDHMDGDKGKLLPHLEAKIVDSNNSLVPVQSFGTLQTKGYHIHSARVNKQGTNVEKEGWFSAGTKARMDEQGNVYLA